MIAGIVGDPLTNMTRPAFNAVVASGGDGSGGTGVITVALLQ